MKRIYANFGGMDWGVNLTLEELESAIKYPRDGFVRIPLLLGELPHGTMRVRPEQICYYIELDS